MHKGFVENDFSMSEAEIARELGISADAVKSAYRRAKKKIQSRGKDLRGFRQAVYDHRTALDARLPPMARDLMDGYKVQSAFE